ncbi:hypothetical protein DV737_g3508, partial [Chaetothyriales sp. CBS 132003]
MAPSRPPRAVDDARSETSSTIFNPKERSSLGAAATNSSVSKQKKAAAIDWTAVSVTVLHTYRTAYRLPTQSSHTHPHADLIYKSSRTALRSPSAVLARRKLHDLKHQRRKAAHQPANTLSKSRSRGREKDKDTDSSSNSDHLLKPYAAAQADGHSHNQPDNPTTSPDASTSTDQSPARPTIIPEYIGKQPPTSLATAVRKHFNAQQLNEATVVSRFTYIAKQARGDHAAIRTDGSAGDGGGCWMGTHGRETRRGNGGDVGFRLRFTP